MTARMRQEEKTRLEEEKRVQKEQQATEKARRDEERRVQKQEAAAEDARKKEEAYAEKERRRAETAAEKERVRLEKEEKRKSKESKPGRISTLLGRGGTAVAVGAAGTAGAAAVTVSEAQPATHHDIAEPTEQVPEGETFHDQVTSSPPGEVSPVVTNLEEPPHAVAEPSSEQKSMEDRRSIEKKNSTEQEREPGSPTKSRVKSWMKVRFGGKNDASKESETMPAVAEAKSEAENEKSAEEEAQVPRTDSMRDVAMAGRTTTTETEDMYGAARKVSPEPATTSHDTGNSEARARSPSISSLSSSYSEDNDVPKHKNFTLGTTEPPEKEDEQKEKPGLKQRLLKKIKPSKDKPKEDPSTAPAATNATDDEYEEARDQFEEETLLPPPPLSTVTGEGSGKKTLSPKGSREGSRFTEEL